ncbi:NTF2-like N-terminal transpeptidase domain-containing protein [Paracerasibacillus soli]|uniref:NTF2-like N-terminal transpeptidase domain-containing protein n=1 Tax=Paracerasibacillus soli TaxID=480284 RepID=A0ABU5CU59_9BACI|nr:NTF2-like N-terminal transpeptidase domain-containing protein [Virgibacillus soli]MDY0409760.1 NTF2-like N-terminal transpeptidase domain-containing protein [Virgibacillus soli]
MDYSLDTVIEKYENIFNGIQINQVHASNVTLSEINDDEQDFSFQLSFTTPLGKLENLQYHTKIVKTGDHFQMKWDPSLILPGMEGKDKVSFRRLKAERGEIKDRLGNGLAVNQDFISIGVVPKELGQGDEEKKGFMKLVNNLTYPSMKLTKS